MFRLSLIGIGLIGTQVLAINIWRLGPGGHSPGATDLGKNWILLSNVSQINGLRNVSFAESHSSLQRVLPDFPNHLSMATQSESSLARMTLGLEGAPRSRDEIFSGWRFYIDLLWDRKLFRCHRRGRWTRRHLVGALQRGGRGMVELWWLCWDSSWLWICISLAALRSFTT